MRTVESIMPTYVPLEARFHFFGCFHPWSYDMPSIKEMRTEQLMRVWKFMLVYFRLRDYASEAFQFQMIVNAIATPRVAHQLKQSIINTNYPVLVTSKFCPSVLEAIERSSKHECVLIRLEKCWQIFYVFSLECIQKTLQV